MLVSFSVSNFRSIGEEQTLNLIASAKITNHSGHLVQIGSTGRSVVRAAVMYGANAAGKSNIIRAMKFAQSLVVEGSNRISLISYSRFRFNPNYFSAPTSFEFRFLISERVFSYGFDIDGPHVRAEWLTVLEASGDRLIFERNAEGKTEPGDSVKQIFPQDEQLPGLLKALASLPLTSSQLLLNRVITLPLEAQGITLGAVVRWLTRELLILLPDHKTPDLLDRLSEDANFRELSERFLDAVGTGVGALKVDVRDVEAFGSGARPRYASSRDLRRLSDFKPKPDDPNRATRRRLLAIHPTANGSTALPFAEESDGTIQLLHLMPVLAAISSGAKVVVIDELDRSLHPLICWEFIRLFSETAPGAHKQLVVTTHEAHLLNQDLLRRDEYWFVEKDHQQQTQLASLSDFKVRNDLKIEKGYLQGRFGAIPFIGSMSEIEKLLNPLNADQEPSCPDDSGH